jgi:L-iditol 2-dehydrogenase
MLSVKKSAIYYGACDLRIEERPVGTLLPGHVMVKMKVASVCDLDPLIYQGIKVGPYGPEPGDVFGHEGSGLITDIALDVRSMLRPGDRVAIEPNVPCGVCDMCKRGRYNMCQDMEFMGVAEHGQPHGYREGLYTEYAIVPARSVHVLPDRVSYEEAALIEPLSVGLYTLRIAGAGPGKKVAVFGCGAAEMCTMLAAQAIGCSEVYLTGASVYKRNRAIELGATEVFGLSRETAAQDILKATGGKGVDVIIDFGAHGRYDDAVHAAAFGATIILVGYPIVKKHEMDFFEVARKGLQLKAFTKYANVYDDVISMLANKRLSAKSIITHEFSFSEINEAMMAERNHEDSYLKAIIRIN